MQLYLWWTVGGSEQTRTIRAVEPGEIVVRGIRHHADHRALAGGDANDYRHGQDGAELEKEVGSTWTAEQLRFAGDGSPVRVVLGQPGSGKTTTLWRAVCRGACWGEGALPDVIASTDHTFQRFAAFVPHGGGDRPER